MPQDAFTLRRNAKELNTLLTGGKINKIVQPNKDELLFYIYTGKSVLKLIISTNASFARICLTDYDREAPAQAPNFCMLLRKHLLGAEILKVEQIDFERIVALTLHCVSDFTQVDRTLYVEVMGKYSNAVLVEKGVILGALKMTSLGESYKRVLFSGAKYALPAPQEKANPLDKAELSEGLRGYDASADKARFLFENIAGIAYPTALQMSVEYAENPCMPLSDYITAYLFDGEDCPCVVYQEGVPAEFGAKRLTGGVKRASLQEAQEELYAYKDKKKAMDEKKRKLTATVANAKKKQEKRLAQILEKLKECEDAEQCRLKGELITANIYQLERGMSVCKLQNYYEENCPEITVSLDKTLTPAQNAQKYYKRYVKLKRTVDALLPRQQAEEREIAYTDSVLSTLARAEELADLIEIEEELIGLGLLKPVQSAKKKKPTEVPFRKFEKDGFIILAGRNNVQNDRLLKSCSPEDLWLHTKNYHSSHVIILTEGNQVPDSVLEYAASVCAYYSDGRNGTKIPVDYCKRKFVKKPSKAKAGFVTYTDYKTLLIDPMEPKNLI
ncbi:MAG: NFACT family protein [Clostridia bacterium]|nr:NFACT family protein [Clostridia bacterium]